ncbi:MAG: CDP-alcohol phosphatidyltransferase family protein [Patescibacteria group bacterium]
MTKLTYRQIDLSQKHRSWTSFIFKRLSVLLVFLLQGLPLTPNIITVISFALVISGVVALAVFNQPLAAIPLLWLSFNFDQVDGIWARIKGQQSAFGVFFDPYTDEIKDHLVDLGFILFYFSRLQLLLTNLRLLVFLMALLLIMKASYYAIRNSEPRHTDYTIDLSRLRFFTYGGAEKFMFVYPLLALSFYFFVFYIGLHLIIYIWHIWLTLQTKRRRLAAEIR